MSDSNISSTARPFTKEEAIKLSTSSIRNDCNDESKGIRRNMATFNYVYNYLENWASYAAVGNQTRENIRILNQAITTLRDRTLELCDVIDNYAEVQTEIDNSAGSSN